MNETQRRLILVRHSTVKIEPDIPSHQWRLSTEGRTRCHHLATLLSHSPPDVFITSTEAKAMETGQILSDSLGVPCRTADNLHEHDRRGVPHIDSKAGFEAAVVDLFLRPNDLVLGRETAADARERFDTAVKTVLTNHPTGDLAIVAHGTVITLFLCQYNPELDPIAFWRTLTLPDHILLSLPGFKIIDTEPI